MLSKKKFDIAISVAEEDLHIAQQITVELSGKGISYYLYTEHRARNWGKQILRILLDVYGAEARYVLMITSKVFVDKYWSSIEKQISEVFNKGKDTYILQLRVDNTPVDGLSKYVVSEKWEDNPVEIAEIIKEKLNQREEVKEPLWLKQSKWVAFLVSFLLLLMLLIDYSRMLFDKRAENEQNGQKMDTSQTKQLPAKSSSDQQVSYLPIVVRDKKNNITGLSRVFLEGGYFMMGKIGDSSGILSPHSVSVNSFLMNTKEITVSEYRAYCNEHGKSLPVQYQQKYLDSCPVVNITWAEALSYCKWVGGRLPTEAEWEFAARAGMDYKYSGGNNASLLAIYGTSKPGRVGIKNPNAAGLYDMTGNIAEWCADWFDSLYYTIGPTKNPQGPLSGTQKIIRGGAYNSKIKPVNQLEVTSRDCESPDSRKPYIGFRVVWDKK